MGFNNIEEKPFGYKVLLTVVRFWHNVVFNRKVIVINKQNIPKDANVIFTPNHQAALMDALAMLYAVPRLLFFLARSDIFKKPAIAAIMYFFKILPVYRQRDGKGSVKKNEAVFKRTAEVLTAGLGMVMFPEGSHEGVYEVLPLKKGFARIAFQTEETNDFSLDIKIIPVGIDYRNPQVFHTSLLVNFGPAISVSNYYEQFKENPALAINDLKEELEGRMRKLIVNIESKEYHSLYILLKDIYNDKMCELLGLAKREHLNQFNADREFVHMLGLFEKDNPEEMPLLNKLVRSYTNKREKFGFANEFMAEGVKSMASLLLKMALLLITFPVFVYGFLNNLLPYGLMVWAGSKIKVPQFISSVKFVLMMIVFPIFYFLQTIVVGFLANQAWLPWAYLLSLPLSGILAFWWNTRFTRFKKQWKFFKLSKKADSSFTKMVEEYGLILEKTSEIISRYFQSKTAL